MKPIAAIATLAVLPIVGAYAQTPQPDLTVTAVRTVPERPSAGTTVHFQAVVKNQGTAPTPEGTVVGGVFKLDNTVAGYEDQYTHTIAPGESVVLTSNGGGGVGDGTWIAKTGSHTLGFLVDDVHRIQDSNRNNNELTGMPFVVRESYGPDLEVRDITAFAQTPSRDKMIFGVSVMNAGNRPTSAKHFRAALRIDGKLIGTATSLHPGLGVNKTAYLLFAPVTMLPGKHNVMATVIPDKSSGDLRHDNDSLQRQFAFRLPYQPEVKPADSLADSVGVCVHLGYLDTSYGKYDIIKRRLIESHIRYVRDGANLSSADILTKLKDLAAHGIKTDFIVNPRQLSPAQAVVLAKDLKSSISTIEGPNEPNLFYSDMFPGGIRQYQNALYVALKADPETASIPVLSPALAFPNEIAKRLGPVDCDFGAMHPYPGGQLPDAGQDMSLTATHIVAPNKPVMTTETGYDTAIHVTTGQPAVSEAAEAKYLPRLFLESFNRGIKRAFAYEFADEKPEPAMHDAEEHFGIIRSDGSPKPAYNAVSNLIQLVQDPGAAFTTTPIKYTLTGDITNLHQTVLQKRDGRVYLIFWLNARSYDLDTHTDTRPGSQVVTLTLGRAFAQAAIFLPSYSLQPGLVAGSQKSLDLNLTDEPLVVQLWPRDSKPH